MHLSVPIVVDTDTAVLQQIDEQVRNAKGEVKARTYYDAAMFMMNKKEGLEEAAVWMDKANEMRPGVFYMMYQQANLANMMGDTAKAKRVGMAALEAAKKAKASDAGDFGYSDRIQKFLDALK